MAGTVTLCPPCGFALLRGQSSTIVRSQDRAEQPPETLRLLVMQIAGQTERMAAGVDELLQHVGALDGIADHRNPSARTDFRDPRPQMRQQQVAVLAGQ